MKYQIRQMLAQGGGSIVNDSSTTGLTGFVRNPVYAASKHGVIGLTKSAALQYVKQGIRINAVCPGVIMTDIIERADARVPGVRKWLESLQPTGQGGLPEQVAEAVAWLCSDAASLITGAAIPVDGGMVAGFW
jgi:NAD(P)-dependent dehydrogenase (short-subunit alcohol dehydrogenase family)